ncbi:MAG: DUF7000 family protein, partial [Anaerolineae bacterium]
ERGAIQKAYRGLMQYMMDLRTQLKIRHPGYSVSGTLYYGYMDMTYFSFSPASLKDRGLKIAIVFLHEAFRFESWLAGVNKQAQSEYWRRLKDSGRGKYRLVADVHGADSILESVLVANPDFCDLDVLTDQIEKRALRFIQDVERHLSHFE